MRKIRGKKRRHKTGKIEEIKKSPGPNGVVAMSSANGYWVRITVLALTKIGLLKAQWVGVRSLTPSSLFTNL